jgi:hypothetical protein
MRDKCLIYYGNPCSSCLSDPEIQNFEDAKRRPVVECPCAGDPVRCSLPRFACVRVAGAGMARRVMQIYAEVSERTLALDRGFFRLRGALPPAAVEAYVDPDRGFERITEPEQVAQRVWEHARSVLDLRPGECLRPQVGPFAPPPTDVPPALLRDTAALVRSGEPCEVADLETVRPWSATPQPARPWPNAGASPLRLASS